MQKKNILSDEIMCRRENAFEAGILAANLHTVHTIVLRIPLPCSPEKFMKLYLEIVQLQPKLKIDSKL